MSGPVPADDWPPARGPFESGSPAGPEHWLTPERSQRLVWVFLFLGLAARGVRYFLRFPLWDDETFLCVQFIDAGFADLLRPLQLHQVAPLLFQWLELACVKLLGFNEMSLRLPAFLGGIASLFLFRHLAGRLVAGWNQVIAMAIFAVSYACIRYSAEAKPYELDLFVALVMMTLAVEFQRRPCQTRWLWLAVLFTPLAIGLSFPAAFVGGGVSLFVALILLSPARPDPIFSLLPPRAAPQPSRNDALAVRSGKRRGWLAWLSFNVVLVAAFAGFFWISARTQMASSGSYMDDYWRGAFPPLSTPWRLPGWLLQTHTGNLLAFPGGGPRGGSALTALACAAAAVVFIRRRQWPWLVLCLAPLFLHLCAAALHRYPYGESVRFSMYAAPAICLLAGCGATTLLSTRRHPATATRLLQGLLLILALLGIGSMARDFAMPYKVPSDARARDFARWFWLNSDIEAVTVCLKSDLHTDFSPSSWRDHSRAIMYRCNEAIYSPRHSRGQRPRWDLIAADRPLRCVEFRSAEWPYDESARQHWLQSMQERYELVSQVSFPLARHDKSERVLNFVDHVDLYTFSPKVAPSLAAPDQENPRR